MSRILVCAGTDSSGGAGLSRDIAMATNMGCAVSPVVTAVTVQTNAALIAIHPVPAAIIAAQVKAAFDPASMPPKAIKIGMIGSPQAAQSLANALPSNLPIILDPVLKSSSGGELMSLDTLKPLLPMVTVLTPNLDESTRLSGSAPIPDADLDLESMRGQAEKILAQGVAAVLIKGGHSKGAQSTDHLFTAHCHDAFSAPRLPGSKRGTGCSLATGIACAMAQGASLHQACATAKTHLGAWLNS